MLQEVEEYLRHGDDAPGLRRMMDLAFDTRDPEMIRSVTAFSAAFRRRIALDDKAMWGPAFQQGAQALLQQLAQRLQPGSVMDQLLLRAEGVTKGYSSGHFSLRPINLDLYAGQLIGIVGENGNGKTTLLRCLSGQLALDSGRVHYTQLDDQEFYTIKNRVAFIPQRIPRWYGRLKDNLHFSAAISGTKNETNELLVDFMLERFGLTEYADLNWNQISSGYRTRFEIARILLLQPQVLILDEPLANLDIHAQQTLLTDLRFLAKSSVHRMGVLLTSQQLHEVEKTADSVMLIRRGECVLQTGQADMKQLGNALELETTATRDMIVNALGSMDVQVQFDGGMFTLISHAYDAHALLQQLLQAGIRISYFRDITTSTKRLF